MKHLLQLACLLPLLAGQLHAEVPRKPLPSKYRNLWVNSPFTVKPTMASAPTYNPLQDYVLLGVSPIKDGYRVTILNSKRPQDERIVIETNRPHEGIEIVEVIRSGNASWDGATPKTKVKISRGGSSATIGYEEKYLALKPPPAAATQPARPNIQVQPSANKPQQTGNRVPRRRIIAPDASAPNTQNTNQRDNSGSSGRTR